LSGAGRHLSLATETRAPVEEKQTQMKFFIDTASITDIREAASIGLLDGVTTNPSLLSKEQGDPEEILLEITKIVPGPVSAEVVALDADGMVREALELRKLADNIVVKIPMTIEGLKAIRRLSDEGVPTNCTLCFSAPQAIMAAKAGAAYISPFVGRLDDISADGMRLIEQICTIYAQYDFATEVLVASVRSPEHVVQSALMGAHVVTMPPKVIQQIAAHPLTDRGLEQFLADWEKVKNR
jgi:transaldolase